MRLSERIKIDNKEYTINELTVEEILDLISSKSEQVDGDKSQKAEEKKVVSIIGQIFGEAGYLTKFLKLAMPGTELGDLVKLAPSEIMLLWGKVKEMNTYFFELAQKLNLGETVILAAREMLNHFSGYAVALSKEAMEEEFSDTDTPSS